jgi:hypothetical protein
MQMQFHDDFNVPQPQATASVLPAYLFDPNFANKVDVDFSNVVWIKRRMVENDRLTHMPVLVCFCKGPDGVQESALKSTQRSFTCHYAKTKGHAKCGFRIGSATLGFLHENAILKNNGEMNVPVCKTCGGSWLIHSSNAKIPDQLGNIQYICNCDPYSSKINIPIDHESVSFSFDLNNYEAAKKLVRPNHQKTTSIPVYKQEVYIPDN